MYRFGADSDVSNAVGVLFATQLVSNWCWCYSGLIDVVTPNLKLSIPLLTNNQGSNKPTK